MRANIGGSIFASTNNFFNLQRTSLSLIVFVFRQANLGGHGRPL